MPPACLISGSSEANVCLPLARPAWAAAKHAEREPTARDVKLQMSRSHSRPSADKVIPARKTKMDA